MNPDNYTARELAQCKVEEGVTPTTDCERAYVLVKEWQDEVDWTTSESEILLPHLLLMASIITELEEDDVDRCANLPRYQRVIQDAIDAVQGFRREMRGFEVDLEEINLSLDRYAVLCAFSNS